MASERADYGVTGWSWSNPCITGTVYVIEELNLGRSSDRMLKAWNMLEMVCQQRRWFLDSHLIFESFDDAVAFRLGFDTGPIKERVVEAQEG